MATASGVLGPKQTKGYFVVLSSMSSGFQYNIAAGSGAGGSYQPATPLPQGTGSSNIAPGNYLKDMGKTVLSSTRMFRKVQLVCASTFPSTAAVNAVTGAPFYIELPTSTNGVVNPGTQVAYLPGLF